MSSPASAKPLPDRIPGLDGLRAIAALTVYAHHVAATAGEPGYSFLSKLAHFTGLLAVPLFFVLSGFLITHLLLVEEENAGTVSLYNFYARRGLRILPAALTYLTVLGILAAWLGLSIKPIELIAAATFWRNFLYDGWASWAHDLAPGAHYTGHFWSLSVEEHFYLLWPFAFALMPPRRRPALLLLLLAVVPFWRALWMWKNGIGGTNYFRTDLVLDYIMAGALLGLVFHQAAGRALLGRLATYRLHSLAAVVAGLILLFHFDRLAALTSVWIGIGRVSLTAALLTLLVAVVVQGESGWFHRFLEHPLSRWLGRISYSFYLWQALFTIKAEMPAWLLEFPVGFAASLACASLSYYFVERPFLRMRSRFHPRTPHPVS